MSVWIVCVSARPGKPRIAFDPISRPTMTMTRQSAIPPPADSTKRDARSYRDAETWNS